MKTINSNSKGYPRMLKALFALTLLFAAAGCEEFVQVELPDSQQGASEVFEDRATATAAMVNIYAEMRDAGMLNGGRNGLSNFMGHYADEFTFYASPSSATIHFYNNALLPSNASVATWWNLAYTQIYASNAVIEGVGQSINLPQADRDLLTGEALFTRALLHYYLNALYGDIPYISTTDYEVNRSVSRLGSALVLQEIIADLERSVILLPEEYVDADRSRPNKFAAASLLSRVQLEAGLWAEAANTAAMVINNEALYGWDASLSDEFLRGSRSTVWQFSSVNEGANTLEAQTFIFTAAPPTQYAVSQDLVDSFSAGDQRKEFWLSPVTDGAQVWYAVSKYKERSQTPSTLECSVMLRLAEQFLIRAEARARQGELIGALEDLNTIRQKAGLDPLALNSQQEILDAVLEERRLELFGELGHRFFDLRRFGQLDSQLGAVKPGWDATDRLLPIPEPEIILNPNLAPQNQGY